jgi:hypothetical protein
LLTGQLDLRCSESLGVGHHSKVFLAPLTFPSTTPRSSVRGAVAVKLSNPRDYAREMLLNEAKIYNAFPHDLQGGDVPIVPKFYGCYTPYIKVSDRVDNGNGSGNLDKEEWTRETMPECMISPILLLEAFGDAVSDYFALSKSGRWERNYHNISLHDEWEGINLMSFILGSQSVRSWSVYMKPGSSRDPCTIATSLSSPVR